jgi:hypothetical protein
MIAAVAFEAALPHIKAFIASMSDDGVSRFTHDVGSLGKQIKELTEKEYKVTADYSALAEMKARLEDLTEAERAYQSTRKTAVQSDIAGRASQAVKETMGSQGFADVVYKERVETEDLSQIDPGLVESLRRARRAVETARQVSQNPNFSIIARESAARQLEDNKEMVKHALTAIDEAQKEAAKQEAGRFAATSAPSHA